MLMLTCLEMPAARGCGLLPFSAFTALLLCVLLWYLRDAPLNSRELSLFLFLHVVDVLRGVYRA